MNGKINLTKSDGTTISADMICILEDTTINKKYVYYTLNETVGTGTSSTVKIYVGKIKESDAEAPLTDDEWNKLKGFMGEVLKNTPNPNIKYVPISSVPDIKFVSERVIAMPVSYDYINKHSTVYKEAIEKEGSSTANVVTPAPVVEKTPEVKEPVPTPTVEPVAPAPETPVMPEPIAPVIPEPIPEPVAQVIPEAPVAGPSEVTPPVTPEPSIPVVPPVPEIVPAPVETPSETLLTSAPVTQSNIDMKPIDINEIENKYKEMFDNLNKLKEQEIEAAKRYNATIELSAMHNEQHASYVANEQNKTAPVLETPVVPTPTPAPTVTPQPVPAEPTPASPTNIETNWFDVQQPAA